MARCFPESSASFTSGRSVGASSSTATSSPPSARSSLASARESAPVSSLPGTARRARADAARANPSDGLRRRGRARADPTRVDTVVSVTTISISWSGEYGGTPQQAAISSSVTSASGERSNWAATSSMGASSTWANQARMARSRRSRAAVSTTAVMTGHRPGRRRR